MAKRRHKHNVAEKSRRTYNSIVYDSRAEMRRAKELDILFYSGEILKWKRQINVQLGPDFKTRVDFCVCDKNGHWYAEEVKGYETREFKLVRRLWPKYARCDMKILKREGTSWSVEWLAGKDG